MLVNGIEELETPMLPVDISHSFFGLQSFSLHSSPTFASKFTSEFSSIDDNDTSEKEKTEIDKSLLTLIVALKDQIINLSEESCFTDEQLSFCLYGLQSLGNESQEVTDLLEVITSKFQRDINAISPRAIAYSLYGLQNMTADNETLLNLVDTIASCIARSDNLLDNKGDTVTAFYGLQNLDNRHDAVENLLGALLQKVANRDLSLSEISNGLYGLQSMYSDREQLHNALATFSKSLEKNTRRRCYLNLEEIVMMMYGLQGCRSNYKEMQSILKSLVVHINTLPKETNSIRNMESKHISMVLRGLRNMSSEDGDEVLGLVKTINERLVREATTCRFDYCDVYSSLIGLMNLSSEHEEVRRLLVTIHRKITMMNGTIPLPVRMLCVEGLSSMSTTHDEVRSILQALRKKTSDSSHQEEQDKKEITALHFSSCLYGLRNCSNTQNQEEIVSLLSSVLSVVSDKNSTLHRETFSSDLICKSLEGLQNMIADNQVKELLRFLTDKFDTCKDETFSPLQVARCMKGMQSMSSDSEEVLNIIQRIETKLENCDELFEPEVIAICLSGLSSMGNDDTSIVKRLITKIVAKTSTPVQGEENIAVDVELAKSQGVVINPSLRSPDVGVDKDTKQDESDGLETVSEESEQYSSSNIDHKLKAYINSSRNIPLDPSYYDVDTAKIDSKSTQLDVAHAKKGKCNGGQLTRKQKSNTREKHERLRKKNLRKAKEKEKMLKKGK